MVAVSRSSRSRRTARGTRRHTGARPRTRPSWAHVGLAVHVLSGRREDHGDGSQGHADSRIERPIVRRRAPLELRCVRVARTNAAVRTERLRRDASGAIRVRREAHGGELCGRGTEQRFQPIRYARGGARVCLGVSSADGRVRRDAHPGRLVRALVGTRAHERDQAGDGRHGSSGQQEGRQDRGEDRRETGPEGAHSRQPAGTVEAGRACRWPVPDRQPATDSDPAPRPGTDASGSRSTSWNT